MRIVVLNPNSSEDVTRTMADGVASRRDHDIVLDRLSDAPAGIETDADVARVTPMVADYAARCRADALVVACFSDPGVDEARRRVSFPVMGIAEAAYLTALALAPRFGIVSLGPASVARHAAHLERLGVSSRLAGDRSVGMSVAEGHSSPDAAERIARVARTLIDTDGAGAVILGCAGMGGHRAGVQAVLGVPVIDPVAAAVGLVMALLEAGYRDGTR